MIGCRCIAGWHRFRFSTERVFSLIEHNSSMVFHIYLILFICFLVSSSATSSVVRSFLWYLTHDLSTTIYVHHLRNSLLFLCFLVVVGFLVQPSRGMVSSSFYHLSNETIRSNSSVYTRPHLIVRSKRNELYSQKRPWFLLIFFLVLRVSYRFLFACSFPQYDWFDCFVKTRVHTIVLNYFVHPNTSPSH